MHRITRSLLRNFLDAGFISNSFGFNYSVLTFLNLPQTVRLSHSFFNLLQTVRLSHSFFSYVLQAVSQTRHFLYYVVVCIILKLIITAIDVKIDKAINMIIICTSLFSP